MRKLTMQRRWVLKHWEDGGWRIIIDRLNTKQSLHDIKMLEKIGLLERDKYDMLRITDAGRQALEQSDASPPNGDAP